MLKKEVISNRSYAIKTVSDEKFLDEIAVKVIKQENPDFLLPVKIININGETEIRYELGDGLCLKYINERMTKKEFLLLLENMIRPFNICGDWFLDYHKFYLDAEYIVVGKNSSEIKYIYRFDDDYSLNEDDILKFFEDLIYNTTLSDAESYKWDLFKVIKDRAITLQSFMAKIVKESSDVQRNAVVQKEERQEKEKRITVDFGEIKKEINYGLEKIKEEIKKEEKSVEKPVSVVEEKISKQFGVPDVKGNLMDNLFGEEEEEPKKAKKKEKKKKEKAEKASSGEQRPKKSLFGGLLSGKKEKVDSFEEKEIKKTASYQNVYQERQPQPEPEKNNIPRQQYETDYTVDDATVIGSVELRESSVEQLVLKLEDDKGFGCPQYIEIDLRKGHATIGRYDKAGIAQADYNFEAALSFISRRHCRIESKAGQFLVIDLGSGNGTLINDVALTPNMPMMLGRGDQLIFSKNKRITYRVC